MPLTVLQRVTIEVRPDTNAWIDTGLTVLDGEELYAYGSGTIDTNNGFAYPEGYYENGEEAPEPPAPGDVLPYSGSSGARAAKWCPVGPSPGTVPLSLVLVVRPPGDDAPDMTGNDDGLRVNRSAVFYNQAGRVWAIFNAPFSRARAFTGAFHLVLERRGERPPDSGDFPFGNVSPIHFVPSSILAVKQSASQVFADLLAVKPVNGPWEGWTSWDKKLVAPEYEDELGNVTPALTYHPNVASRSAQPVAVTLDVRSADVTVFAPKFYNVTQDATVVFMDRVRIDSGYYDGAYWEYAQVDPRTPMNDRLLVHCGFIGNIQFDDLIATLELSGFEIMANRDIGDELHFICQVGARIGEEFGTHRCEGPILHDGPKRDDWTVEGTVVEGGYDTIRISYGAVAKSGVALDDSKFKNRLGNGDVYFWSAPAGGPNAGTRMVIKNGIVAADHQTTVRLRLSLYQPAKVGDKVWLVAGCDRKKATCRDVWDNLPNMRAQDLESNSDLLQRYRTGEG